MAGLDPAIYVLLERAKTWMPAKLAVKYGTRSTSKKRVARAAKQPQHSKLTEIA